MLRIKLSRKPLWYSTKCKGDCALSESNGTYFYLLCQNDHLWTEMAHTIQYQHIILFAVYDSEDYFITGTTSSLELMSVFHERKPPCENQKFGYHFGVPLSSILKQPQKTDCCTPPRQIWCRNKGNFIPTSWLGFNLGQVNLWQGRIIPKHVSD